MSPMNPWHRFAACLALVAAAGCGSLRRPGPAGAMDRPDELARLAGWEGRSPNSADAFTFVVLSDRTGGAVPGEWEQAVKEANLLKPDFVMCVGDLVEGYSTNAAAIAAMMDEFDAIVNKLDAPFFYCPGNHDVEQTKTKATLMREGYTARHGVNGATWYSFDYRGCHFAVLDSSALQERPDLAEPQFAWLADDMRRAADARHVFVFFHHPFFPPEPGQADAEKAQALMVRLYSAFPKGKTTVFNGHWHTLDYQAVMGVPTYVLATTGAGSQNRREAGDYRMFAHVSVSGGEPSIAFVPTRELQPASSAELASFMQHGFAAAYGGLAVAADGGTVGMEVENPLDAPLTLTLTVATNGAWTATPPSQVVTLPSGGRQRVAFVARPRSATPPATGPAVAATLCWPSRDAAVLTAVLPVVRSGALARVAPMAMDGTPEKWAAVPAVDLRDTALVFAGRETWSGPADASAALRVATDGSNLYVRVEVSDDEVVPDGRAPWSGADGIEFMWDGRPQQKRNGSMEAGTGQFGICPSSTNGVATGLNFIPAGKYGQPMPAGLRTHSARTPQGYTLEFSLPAAVLGVAPGQALTAAGVELFIDDKDAGAPHTRLSISGKDIGWSNPGVYMRLGPAH